MLIQFGKSEIEEVKNRSRSLNLKIREEIIMNKKITSMIVLGATILCNNQLVVFAQDYENNQFKNDINQALNRKIISLDNKNNFYPNSNITRAEFAAMLSNALNLKELSSTQFTDVPKSHPYYTEISKANKAGIIVGYNAKEFKPNQPITREELTLMIYRYAEKTNVKIPIEKKEPFKDANKLRYPQVIQAARNYNLVAGYEDNSFRGTNLITKGESTSILIRLIDKIEKYPTNPQLQSQYFVKNNNGDKVTFNNYTDAYNNFKNKKEMAYLGKDNEIIDTNFGVARTKAYTLVYKDGEKEAFTYLMADSELKITRTVGDKVYVKIGNVELYVNANDVSIVPITANQNTSYYINQNGVLYHKIYNNGSPYSYQFGKAPEFMEENIPYRSIEGNKIAGEDVIQYFNYLPLRTPTSYTGAQLDSYIKANSPKSPLIGYGQVFVSAANKYKINPMYLLANAIHESAWGTSKIAIDKKNLFGFKAYDSDAYGSAASFSTLEEGIYYCAKYISDRYLTTTSWAYNGEILGNKSIGMNVKYASDPYWGQKIAGHMTRMDALLGNKERNKYLLGYVEKDVPLYSIKNGKKESIGKNAKLRIVAKKDTIQTSSGAFIQLFSDDINYDYVYVSPTDFKEMKTY
ncbi:hypothetical protein COJ15_16935 [Bacillus thuringiensis]|uniref:SLH domain-containing protein n=2 Tax=Bacillus thuringiensis TaxID=1428 RepID=A0A9X6ZSZ6_BACTU|nr:hypothetical protein COJ15_16935 [Bacillus thuringiensis]